MHPKHIKFELHGKKIMEHRRLDPAKEPLLEQSLLATIGNEEVLSRCIANTDLQEPVAELVATATRKKEARVVAVSGAAELELGQAIAVPDAAAVAASAASSQEARQPPVIDYEIDGTIEAKQAQKLLPNTAKYKLTKDKTLHMRWQLKWTDSGGQLRHFSKGCGGPEVHVL